MTHSRLTIALFAIFYILTFSAAPVALAHGVVSFEFAPDPWASTRLIASSGATPYQLFSPQSNITLTAFDLWLDNTGESGPITFTLADEEGTTLNTITTELPTLSAVPGGNKFHVNLTKDVALTAGKVYSIKIDCGLLGFGLYYANRINVLEHNRVVANEYTGGAARLGQETQSYSFKFALRSPAPTGGDGADDTEPANQSSPAPNIMITNARVVGTTPTTATFAWTTNIAADTRVTLRTQLNPLYVVASGFDPTLELEHYITVGGLIPNVNYFADVFSGQGSALLLTTYTIGFKTPLQSTTQSAPESQQTTSTAQQTQNQTSEQKSQSTAQSQTNSQNSSQSQQNTGSQNTTSNSTNGAAGTTNSLSITTNGSPELSWEELTAGDAPENGYRIDIFDSNNELVRQVNLPGTTENYALKDLEPGTHTIIVYASRASSTYEKVAPAKTILVQSRDMTLTLKIIGVAALWIATWSAYFWWKFKKEKIVLPPEEGYDPNQ